MVGLDGAGHGIDRADWLTVVSEILRRLGSSVCDPIFTNAIGAARISRARLRAASESVAPELHADPSISAGRCEVDVAGPERASVCGPRRSAFALGGCVRFPEGW